MEKKIYLESIKKFKATKVEKTAFVGFDGFVDNIIRVVDKRFDKDHYNSIKTIEDFGKRILAAKGKSTNMELVSKQLKMGGNAPLMASPMINFEIKINFIGAIGKDKINDVFKDFAKKCYRYFSLSEPGYTMALEFDDGKIMLGQMNHLFDINRDKVIERIGIKNLKEMITESSLFAFTNWTMLSGLNGIIEEFSSLFDNFPYVFIDLADPQKRTKSDLSEILNLIKKISYKSKIIFGMNKKESEQISDVLDIDIEDLSSRADAIRKKLNLHTVLLHSLKSAIVSYDEQSVYLPAPYEPNPTITTGAGDHLNGGFCSALLHGLNPVESLSVALFTAGFYVRKAYSPNKTELLQFAKEYFGEK